MVLAAPTAHRLLKAVFAPVALRAAQSSLAI